MEAPIKKPKPKKPRKRRKPRKASKPSTGTNITINVGTSSSRAPRRARAPAKPKVDPTANQFGFRSPGGGGSGVLPSFAGQADQFRQVIYPPQGDVSGSIKALEKSIETLSRSGDSQAGDRARPPFNFVGPRDDESQSGREEPAETPAEKRDRERRLRAAGFNPMSSISELGGLSRAEINRRLDAESRTQQAQREMMRQYEPEEGQPLGS